MKEAFNNVDLKCIPNVVPQCGCSAISSSKVILNVARLDKKQKRQHLLITAFAKLAPLFPQWQLEFWGEEQFNNSYTEELRQLIVENELQKQVHFYNNTSDIMATYRHAAIFALPSAFEGFPLAMTEAMSTGLPIVAYNSCSGVNELIANGENGFLVADGIEPFIKGLEQLMENHELREKMGKAAHEAMKQFAPEKIWDKWEELLEKVVGNHRNKEN